MARSTRALSAAHPAEIAPDVSDAELVARAQTGHVEAFAELYDRHAGHVLRVARRILGSGGDADDLLHDVFLEAWQSVRDYDPNRASVVTWLLVRTRSRAADRLARRSRERHAQSQLHLAAHALVAPPPAAELALATRDALGQLESPLRAALELMYVAGLTAPEISAQTGVAEGTVRSRVARGLIKLERALR
jgi:RNA polymerase sigma-70 factor (ECF subfamily)